MNHNHKKFFHEIISTVLMITIVAGAFFGVNFYQPKKAEAATYTFQQNDWTGGNTANNAVHPTNQSNWNQYSTSTSGLTIGADLRLPQSSYTFTDDGATSTTSGSATGGGFGNGTNSNTAISGSGTGASVALTKTVTANTWSVMANAPGTVGWGGSLAYDNSGNIFALQGNGTTVFWKYSISANTWSVMAPTPTNVYRNGNFLSYDNSGNFYARAGNNTNVFYKYSISTNTWSTMAPMPAGGDGGSLSYDNSGNFYALRGNSAGVTTAFWKYTISTNTWSTMAPIPTVNGYGTYGGSLAYDDSGNFYTLFGQAGGNPQNVFYKYTISTNTWSTMAVAPAAINGGDYGSSLSYDGSGNIYAFQGDTTTGFWKYSISSNTWSIMAVAPGTVYRGGSLAYDNSGNIYAFQGNSTTAFWKYNIYDQYASSGNFTSAVIDTGAGATWTTLNWNDSVPSGTSISVKVRSSATSTMSGAPAWSSCTAISKGANLSTGGCVTNGHRYAQYQTSLTGNGNIWSTMAVAPANVYYGGSLAYDNSGNIYAFGGGNNVTFWKYVISTNTWSTMANAPGTVSTGGSLAYDSSGNIYAFRGGTATTFWKYTISTNTWSVMTVAPGSVSDGGSLTYDNSGNIYAFRGSGAASNNFWKYVISTNTWSVMAVTLGSVNYGGSLSYDNSGNIYAFRGYNTTTFWKYVISTNTWSVMAVAPGNVSDGGSLAYDNSGNIYAFQGNATTTFWKYTISTNTWSVMTVAPGNVSDGGSLAYDNSGNIYAFQSNATTFWKYSINNRNSASLTNATISYTQYPISAELTSSRYDASDGANLIAKISWSETATSTTNKVRLQIRSSPDGSTWSNWCGYSDTGSTCAGTNYFDSDKNNVTLSTNNPLRSDANDRYLQYKVWLESDGSGTAIADNIVITYVVNAAPQFDASYGTNGVTVSQVATSSDPNWGKVKVSYSVLDEDTNTGANQYEITPSFEYNTGSGWQAITSSYLAAGDLNDKTVATSTYNTYDATWSAANQIGSAYYSTTTQVKVTVNDSEAANNIASSTSANFTLDTKAPTPTSIAIDSSADSDIITYNFVDDSNIEYRLSNNPLTGESWISANATSTTASTTWTLSGNTASETVYFSVRDIYGNTASAFDNAPGAPTNFYFKDISNPPTNDYREFLSWGLYQATTSAAFGSYQIYRSTDGTNYSSLATISDSATNYYTDNSVSSSTTYYYKARFVDSDNDIGNYNTPISDKPDGQGGSDPTQPTISNASSTIVQSTWAKITWTTDEIASSTVEYSTQSANNYASSTTVNSFVTSHEVTITGLTPNTAYVYRVRSTDPSGNAALASGYSFTTAGGPIISSVSCSETADNSITIIWNTDKATNSSQITYSSYSNLASPSTASVSANSTSTTALYQHSAALTGLTQSTKYYFKVVSTDTSANSTIEDNGGNYYSCSTTKDTKPPVISNITTPLRTANAVVIMWETDEPATSQVEYGLASATTGNYATTTARDNTMTRIHIVTISSGLLPETTYYYRVKSYDMNPDSLTSVSGEQTVQTTAERETVIIYTVSGGGGAAIQDATPPTISGVSVSDIGAFGATVNFTADEPALAIIEYGETTGYGTISAGADYQSSHSVKLTGLKMGADYHLRIKAIDKSANYSYSADTPFTTKYFSEMVKELRELAKTENLYAFQQAIEESIESIAPSIIPPFIEEPRVLDITENSATIKWKTNIPAYSAVSFASENDYDASQPNPYIAESSQTEQKKTSHEISLSGLGPDTRYHFKVKSYVLPQATGESKDMTFATKAPKISARVVDIDNDAIRIVWTTAEPATSIVEYKNLRTGEINRKTKDEKITNHDIRLENLDTDTAYEISVYGYNERGNLIEAGEPITAKTSRDIIPPQISGVKIDSAMVPGRADRVQTIVSWRTDEPATSVVQYEEGSTRTGEELTNKTAITDSLTQNHTIILTKFKPGTLYQIRIVSTDDANNKTVSPIRTIITPRQSESIIDVVVKNFEETFQFLQNLR